MTTEQFNNKLAHACQSCDAACCKKGLLFLPRVEHERMRAHAQKLGSAAIAEFDGRVKDHGDFFLYDQKDRCQFLSGQNLCELHPLGIKPSECFWWPYHVYARGPEESLEIRLSNSCCDGYRAHGPHSPYPVHIEKSVNAIGFEVVRAFRRQYGGSYDTQFIQSVDQLEETYLGVANLPAYRAVGEKLFPDANWDLGMKRYAEMLPLYPRGLLALRLRGDILGYLSLWPVDAAFAKRFGNDCASDDELTASALHRGSPETAPAWFLTSVAILESDRALRSRIRARIVAEIHGALSANPSARVFAEAVTARGDAFLKRHGFKFVFSGLPQRCVVSAKEFVAT